MAKSYRELRVWKQAMDLTTAVYELSASFPKSEVYGLSSQMRRAAISIPSNIAEGSARSTRKDFRQFVVIARGSNCELQTQLMVAERLGFAAPERIRKVEVLTQDVGQMLSGLANYLKQPPRSPQHNGERTTENGERNGSSCR